MIYILVLISGLLGGSIALIVHSIYSKYETRKFTLKAHDNCFSCVREKALAAERFASDNLVREMQIPGAEGNIRAFAMLVSMLDASIVNFSQQLAPHEIETFKKIRELMFAYQQLAQQCTELATQIRSMRKTPATCMLADYFQRRLVSNITQCVKYRKEWNDLLTKPN